MTGSLWRIAAGTTSVALPLGLVLATGTRLAAPQDTNLESWLGWSAVWMVAGTLAVLAFAAALHVPDHPEEPPTKEPIHSIWVAIIGGFTIAFLTENPVIGILFCLSCIPIRALAGDRAIAPLVWATCPAVLACHLPVEGVYWRAGTLCALLMGLHGVDRDRPAGVVVLSIASAASPVVAAMAAVDSWTRGRPVLWVFAPLAAGTVGFVSQPLHPDLALGPPSALLLQSLQLGWPFGVVLMFLAPPRWQTMAVVGCLCAAVTGANATWPLVVPVVLGSVSAELPLSTRSKRAFWGATVVVTLWVHGHQRFHPPFLEGILWMEDR